MSRYIRTRRDVDALKRSEDVTIALFRGATKFRRLYDDGNIVRHVHVSTVRRHPTLGLVARVQGFVDGAEDKGLNCPDCPLSDLVPLVPKGDLERPMQDGLLCHQDLYGKGATALDLARLARGELADVYEILQRWLLDGVVVHGERTDGHPTYGLVAGAW